MSFKQLSQVSEFNKVFQSPEINHYTEPAPKNLLRLRAKLIEEEADEVVHEIISTDYDPIKVAKELADLIYVTLGTVSSLGLNEVFEDVFDEVHRSNMSKLNKDGKPIFNEYGKVLKSDQYTSADLSFLNKQ